jgi:3-dehydroquinate synthetase/shikimate kinase
MLRPLVPPVVLLGPPGAGKSAVGRRLADRLGFTFVDLDQVIGIDHLTRGGLADFRVREYRALTAALAHGPVVIAAGAGVVDTGPARDVLALALCVVLDVDADVALSRIPDGTRPWLPDRRAGGDGERRAAWVAREAGRAAHRRELADARVIDARHELGAVVDAAEEAVRGFSLGAAAADPGTERSSLDEAGPGFVIADAVVADRLRRVDHVLVDGTRKDATRLFELLAALARAGITRDHHIVVVGGGALLDVGGLAAALHHRGTSWTAVPTTLLSMVDAALGGKTAVDVAVDGAVVRNGAGAFFPPSTVVIDPAFLATLSPAQRRHGRAEMWKHALLAGVDVAGGVDDVIDIAAIHASRSFKRFVVLRDPREAWLRQALNLGHTFAHAFESRFGLPHGDAVLHGLRAAVHASVIVAGLDAQTASDLLAAAHGLTPPPLPALTHDDVLAVVASMRRDKKARQGVRLILLSAPGRPVLADVDDDVATEALHTASRAGGV